MKPGGKWKDDNADLKDFQEKISQDRGLLSYPFSNDTNQLFAVVCDGHGEDGENIADFACKALLERLASLCTGQVADIASTLKTAFVEVGQQLSDSHLEPTAQDAGTTASVMLMREQQVVIGWVGDSRCVKGSRGPSGEWVSTDLTQDHHPDHAGERKRLQKAGAYISPPKENEPSRVYRGRRTAKGLEIDDMNPGLGIANTRSIGDLAMATCGVTAEPESAVFTLETDDTCLILASDGIWEFISSAEAVATCARHTSAADAAQELIATATQKWSEVDEGCYRDDITCTVIFLPLFDQLRAHTSGPA